MNNAVATPLCAMVPEGTACNGVKKHGFSEAMIKRECRKSTQNTCFWSFVAVIILQLLLDEAAAEKRTTLSRVRLCQTHPRLSCRARWTLTSGVCDTLQE